MIFWSHKTKFRYRNIEDWLQWLTCVECRLNTKIPLKHKLINYIRNKREDKIYKSTY